MKKVQGNEEAKKKWENFWYYYKYHVLAGVFVPVSYTHLDVYKRQSGNYNCRRWFQG